MKREIIVERKKSIWRRIEGIEKEELRVGKKKGMIKMMEKENEMEGRLIV